MLSSIPGNGANYGKISRGFNYIIHRPWVILQEINVREDQRGDQ